ncbi:M16 family metallopeptidase [Flagellimonas zhangzhouensis]|uniref:Zinc protease n=1 Tax=Flagellimonas zhangzhouensis TaxID=1073328 RepID=A0A1H2VRM5_9FLAO|nr:pitrilysin family protein [Allomuricauda zhangzhouensis]SDQ06076.1 zinc protease [Allomuricauda zhangzhouensis]SDW70985.1 zinc protease [Allomuricauda zhangzhouensis]
MQKKFLRRFLMSIFLASTLTAIGQIKKVATVEGITEYQMENGLKVLLFPDNSSQTITVNITYLVGSRHEGYGEKGMAHLLEHMVFKGTPNHPDIPKELSSHGARPNGTTWYDRTNYFETFNATDENLNWALDLEADRMMNSFIAKEDLESEFTVVRNEFESGENNPTGVLLKKVTNVAFEWHNYGSSTIGNRSDIERVPIENLQAFYKKFYRPDNAVLMVTGKFEEAKVLGLIEKKFGDLKAPDVPLRDSYTEEPEQDGERYVTVSRVGDLQIVSALYHTPAGADEDYAAIAVVDNILNDTPSGRLYKKLIETQKASSLWSFSPFTKEPGFLYINIDVPSDKNADEVEQIVKSTLDGLEPITQEELDRAKANLLKEMDEINRNSSYLGRYMSEFIGAGDWRLSFIHRDRVEALTLEEANTVMKKYLIPSNRTLGRFVPTKDPVRIAIPHPENVDALVADYKGREDKGTGEVFDVSYDNIESRLETGKLLDKIEYGLIEKDNRGQTVILSFNMRNGDVNSLMNQGMVPSFTASMLDKGTTSKSRQEIEDELSKLKSSLRFYARNGNIYSSVESTEENLMGTMALLAEIIKNPSFDEGELSKLKAERLAGIERNRTEPGFLASMRLSEINQTYPKGHPLYSMNLDEQIEAINAVTKQDLVDFYNKFYGLGRSTMVAIGNFSSDALKSFMEENFKGFESEVSYAEIKDPYKKNKAVNENIITPDKKNAVTYGTLAVEMSQYDDDYPAMVIAGEILGGGFLNSRFADRLRQKDGVSYGVGANFGADGDQEDKNSSIFLYAIYNPDNLEKVQLGFKEELDRYIADGITDEEFENAVNGWIQGQTVSRAKDNELSSLVNNNIYYYRTMDFHKGIEAKMKALTKEDVNKAIKKYIKPFSDWTIVNGGDFK